MRSRAAPSGEPVLDACVTLIRPFVDPPPVDELAERVQAIVEPFPPLTVRTVAPDVITGAGVATVVLPLEESAQLRRLRAEIGRAVWPVTTPLDGHGEHEDFQPHVTVVAGIDVDGVEKTIRAINGWRVNYFWTLRDVDLVGREGGQLWRTLARVKFGRLRG